MARTTLTVEDTLFARLRELAARRHRTIAQTLNEILAGYFRPRPKKTAYRLQWNVVTGTREPPVDPADRDRLHELLDRPS